jgi:hypothetical protein
MRIIYLIGVIAALTFFYSLRRINNRPTEEFADEKNEIKEQSLKERSDIIDRPTIGKDNKWLYPTDGFGKMEEGVVD